MLEKVSSYFEKNAFGVCTWLGSKLGVKSNSIRLSFIYLSFLTFGSPLIIYLIMAFVLDNKDYFKSKRSHKSIWELE